MTQMETKLQQVWGAAQFCRQCAQPTYASGCSHGDEASWSELSPREQMRVRWNTIQKAKAAALAETVLTVAS